MKWKDQRGAAVVEFAVVLPVLAVILFGIIEFSVYFYEKAMITNASREGARAGIVFADPRPSDSQIEEAVDIALREDRDDPSKGYLLLTKNTPPTLANANNKLTITRGGTNTTGDSLTVTIEYNFDFLVFSNLIQLIGSDYFGEGIPMKAVTRMRLE